MSSDPKKVSPKKTAPQRSPAAKGPAKKPGTPTKVVKKTIPAKPIPKKPAPVEKEKKQGGGLFSSIFGIFKKKAPKEEAINENASKTATLNEEPQNGVIANTVIPETEIAIEQEIINDSIAEENIAEKEEEAIETQEAEEVPLQEKPVAAEPPPLEKEEKVETPPPIFAAKAPVPEIQFPEEEKIIEKEEPVKHDYSYNAPAYSYTTPVKEESTVQTEMETTNTTHAYNYSGQTPDKEVAENFSETAAAKNFAGEETPEEEKKKKRGILLSFLIVSLIANGILAWLLMKEHNKADTVIVLKQKIIVERDNIMSDLEKLKTEYSTLKTNDTLLQKELDAKRADIEKMIIQAKKHQNDSYIIAKLHKETETLRKIMKHYVVEIDSLNTLNQTIIAQKNQVTKDLNSQINKTNELEKDKDALLKTVSKGSVLKAQSPKALGIKLRGGTKQVDVSKASRVEKIKVSFTIGENSIAKKGTKTIYIHIMGPNGKEVTVSESEQNSIQYDGTKGFYAEKQDIEYDNTELPVSILCGNPNPFVPGKYLVDVICEGTVIGQTEVTFK